MASGTQTYKQAAVDFLQLVVAGRIDEAYRKYVDMNGKHHNAFFAAGFPSLQKAMMENHAKLPNKQFTVKNVIGDGNLVAVHSRLILQRDGPAPPSGERGEQEMVVVHILRFHGDKIVEMWDCGQAIPKDLPNKDGAF